MNKAQSSAQFLAAPNLSITATESVIAASVLLAGAPSSSLSSAVNRTSPITVSCLPLFVETKGELTLLNENEVIALLPKDLTIKFHPDQEFRCLIVSSEDLTQDLQNAINFRDRCLVATQEDEQLILLAELNSNSHLLSAVRTIIGSKTTKEHLVRSDAMHLFELSRSTASSRVKSVCGGGDNNSDETSSCEPTDDKSIDDGSLTDIHTTPSEQAISKQVDEFHFAAGSLRVALGDSLPEQLFRALLSKNASDLNQHETSVLAQLCAHLCKSESLAAQEDKAISYLKEYKIESEIFRTILKMNNNGN